MPCGQSLVEFGSRAWGDRLGRRMKTDRGRRPGERRPRFRLLSCFSGAPVSPGLVCAIGWVSEGQPPVSSALVVSRL